MAFSTRTDRMRSLHDFVSTHVVHPAYRAYRALRPAHRRALRAYRAGLSFREGAASWSAERRREWVLGRLRRVVRDAAADLPFYAERLRAAGFDAAADFGFEDFARLPVLEREEVHAAGTALRSDRVPASERRRDSTGGSTGQPTEIWTGPEERGWRESGIAHFMRGLGLPSGTRTALFWGHHLDPVARDSLRDRVEDWLMNVRWYDCLRLSPDVLKRYHDSMEAWRPACIIAYAGALATLAEELDARGISPSYPTRAMVTGAEKLRPDQREVVERVFRRRVFERYGSRDIGLMAFQSLTPGDVAYDVDWANVLVEPETDEPESAILVTKLHADAMPMIRYRVGDIARFAPGARPGAPAFRLEEVVGRDTDRIWLRDGSWVHGIEYPHMMKDFPVREFQVHQRADYHVVVRVVPSGEFPEAARQRLVRTIADNLPGLEPELEFVESIPRTKSNKLRPVITEVRRPPRSRA